MARSPAISSGAVTVVVAPSGSHTHETVVAAPDGRFAVNTTGNSGLAKGGSGDVLAGMIVSLLGQGMEAFEACCAAVYLHGRAGDLAAADQGERGMTPGDLLEQIPYALKETDR